MKGIKFTDVWIKQHGSLPKNYEIIHIDGNHQNNNFANLKIVGENATS